MDYYEKIQFIKLKITTNETIQIMYKHLPLYALMTPLLVSCNNNLNEVLDDEFKTEN